MKQIIITIVTVLISFLLQTTVFRFLALAGVVPNLLIIVTVASGYINGRKAAMFTGILCGMLMDLMYGDLIGLYTLFFLVIGYVNGLVHKFYFKNDLIIPVALVGISDLAFNVLYYVTEFLLRSRLHLGTYIVKIILPEMVYTIVVSILLYKLLHSINSRMKKTTE